MADGIDKGRFVVHGEKGSHKIEDTWKTKYPAARQREDQLNAAIDEVIALIADGHYEGSVEGLRFLADIYRSAGMSKRSWLALCQLIETSAVRKTGAELTIKTHMGRALREAHRRTTGSIIVGVKH